MQLYNNNNAFYFPSSDNDITAHKTNHPMLRMALQIFPLEQASFEDLPCTHSA